MYAAYTMPADIKPSTTWLKMRKPWYAVMGAASVDGLLDKCGGRSQQTSVDAAQAGICCPCGSAHTPCGSTLVRRGRPHTLRRPIIALILLMASAGFKPSGQTSVWRAAAQAATGQHPLMQGLSAAAPMPLKQHRQHVNPPRKGNPPWPRGCGQTRAEATATDHVDWMSAEGENPPMSTPTPQITWPDDDGVPQHAD